MTKQDIQGDFTGQLAGGDIINEAPRNVMNLRVGGSIGGHVINGNAVFHLPAEAPKPKVKVIVPTGPQHISEEQAAVLARLVREIVELEKRQKKAPKGFQAVWGAVNAHCRVTQYRLIPAASFDKAEKYLRQWIGRLSSMASAPKADNDGWRVRKYKFIKVNTKAPDDAAWFAAYLRRAFDVDSISELDDKALARAYGAVASRKRDKGRRADTPEGS